MMKIILPLLIVLIGVGGGGAAGYFLAPEPPEAADCVCEQAVETHADGSAPDDGGQADEDALEEYEYVNFSNQFVVPVIENESVNGMVVLSLSMEVTPGSKEMVFSRQPKLRDEFLRILFAYTSIGGFAGNYLESNDLKMIRGDLTKAAKDLLGPVVNEVLIVDLVRQDI